MDFNIPYTTLLRRFNHPEVKDKPGPNSALTEDEEEAIADWMIGCKERGVPPRTIDVIEAANMILKRRNGDANLGRGWLQKFIKRRKFTYRIPENLSCASANITQDDIEKWFQQVLQYIVDRPEFLEAIQNKRRVYNGDECMFKLCSSSAKVLAPKGSKSVFEVTKDDKFGLTVMATFSADGKGCKPFVIYPQERVSTQLHESFPHEKASYALTKSGWMDSSTFCLYLSRLADEIRDDGVEFPVILFVDNHSSHVSLESSETADQLGIKMIYLYPNSTFLTQPADVAIFRSLKSIWRKENRSAKNHQITISKNNFAGHFIRAYEQIPKSAIKNGFFKCGIFPWDSSNIDFSKCLGKKNSRKLDNSLFKVL